MSDKDLTINIKTVGADAAAAAVHKVEKSTDNLADSIPSNAKGFGGMLDNVPKRAEEATESIRKLKAETAELKETADQTAKSIFAIEDAAKQAVHEADVMDAERRLAQKDSTASPKLPLGGKDKAATKFDPNFGVDGNLVGKISAAAPAALAAVGVEALRSTSKAVDTLRQLKEVAHETGQELGIEFTSQMDAAVEGFGPLNKAVNWLKGSLSTLWTTIKDPIGELTGINDVNKALKGQQEVVENLRKKHIERAAQHEVENQKILASDRQLLAAQHALSQGREARSGTSAEQSAANQIQRMIQQNELEKKGIIDALVAAQQREMEALADAKNKKLSEATRAAAAKIAEDSAKQVADLERNLSTRIQTDGLAVQNSVEDAQAKATEGLNAKLTANAQALQKKIEGAIAENGPATQAGTRMALEKVSAVLADGKATSDEVAKLESAAVIFQQSADSNKDGLRASAQKLMESNKQAVDAKTAIDAQVEQSISNQPLIAQTVETLGVSQTEIGKNIEAAANSAGQVKAAIDGERAGTVSAIQALAPQPQDSQAIITAIQTTAKELERQHNAVIATFAAWQAGIAQTTNRQKQQQAQINQLFQRLR